MITIRIHKGLGIVLLVLAILALGTGWAVASGEDVVYHACANDSNGVLRYVVAEEACGQNESRLVWNMHGPQGLPGKDGQPGKDGPPGQDGLHCWDLNGNGATNLRSEDRNGDLAVNVLDCQGQQGEQGPQGVQGSPGEQGPPGLQGPQGEPGPAGQDGTTLEVKRLSPTPCNSDGPTEIGWCPDGGRTRFIIYDNEATPDSFIPISLQYQYDNGSVCMVVSVYVNGGLIYIGCTLPVSPMAELRYTILN